MSFSRIRWPWAGVSIRSETKPWTIWPTIFAASHRVPDWTDHGDEKSCAVAIVAMTERCRPGAVADSGVFGFIQHRGRGGLRGRLSGGVMTTAESTAQL